jgi:hypothetical protein
MRYAYGPDQDSLFPDDFVDPGFYYNITSAPGNHTLEIIGTDDSGLVTTKKVTFQVLEPEWLGGSTWGGDSVWYNCNENKDTPPCSYVYEDYCDKIVPNDLAVRQAAAEAISEHPGSFSVNQLLDVYDWVRENIFYQNVPVDTWPPYPPNETLKTKSGDCKNQAVLIASMVEAIGGSARVLYIPDCEHAFSEVYLGSRDDVEDLSDAIWAHYDIYDMSEQKSPTWHIHTNEYNETENWFIFDTAGGWYPGNTIDECMNASTVYYLLDCNRDPDDLNAPDFSGIEYGPLLRQNDTQIIQAEWGYNYWLTPWIDNVPEFTYCTYDLHIKSLSTKPIDWYLTDEEGYEDRQAHKSFSYYYGEEQVMESDYEFTWDTADEFYIILINSNTKSSVTVRTEITETCYKD